MGSGFRLLGYPKDTKQLLLNLFDAFGVPTPDTWPGVEQLPVYNTCCSDQAYKENYGLMEPTTEADACDMLDFATGHNAGRSLQLAPDRAALALVVAACLTLNPAARPCASTARDNLRAAAAQLESQLAANVAGVSESSSLTMALLVPPRAALLAGPASSSLPASIANTPYSSVNFGAVKTEHTHQAVKIEPNIMTIDAESFPSHKRNHTVISSSDSDQESSTAAAVVTATPDAPAAAVSHDVPPAATCAQAAAELTPAVVAQRPLFAPSRAAASAAAAAPVQAAQTSPGRQPCKLKRVSVGSHGPAHCKVEPCADKLASITSESMLSVSSSLTKVASVPHTVSDLPREPHKPAKRLRGSDSHSDGACRITLDAGACSSQASLWMAVPADIDNMLWIHDRHDRNAKPRLARFLTSFETATACERITSMSAQGTYRRLTISAAKDVGDATGTTATWSLMRAPQPHPLQRQLQTQATATGTQEGGPRR